MRRIRKQYIPLLKRFDLFQSGFNMSRNTAVRAVSMLGTYENLLVEQAYNQLQSESKI